MHATRIFALSIILIWSIALIGCKNSEKVVEIYPNGNPKRVLVYNEDQELVQVKSFHFNGIRATRVNYKNNKPHGLFERWDTNGEITEEAEFRNGVRQGTTETWYHKRMRMSLSHFENGLLEGMQTGFYPDGELQFEKEYRKGIPVGTWLYWYPDQRVQERNSCHTSNAEGIRTTFFPSGIMNREEHCKQGILEGTFVENYPAGALKLRGAYAAGKPEGRWQWFRADASLWRELDFHQGIRHGVYTGWTDQKDSLWSTQFQAGTGSVRIPCIHNRTLICSDSSWVAGQLHGTIFNWDHLTRIRSEELWAQGLQQSSRDWRTDSLGTPKQLLREGSWKEGKRAGLWRTWHRNGNIKDSLQYQNGELWGMQYYYDSTGHLYLAKQNQGKMGQVIVKTLDPKPFEAAPSP